MKSIEELQHDLKKIYNELEEIKESQRIDTDVSVNFKEISATAKRYPISGHPLLNEDEHAKQTYLMMLLSVAELDVEKYPDTYCMIYRIAYGIKFTGDIQELALIAKQMNFERLDECTRLFENTDLKLLLILDCMLIAGFFEKGKNEAYEYISKLCVLLKVGKEQVTFLANMARVILTQDLNEYKCDIPNTYENLFDCYLNEFDEQFKIEIFSPKDLEIISKNRRSYETYEFKITLNKSNIHIDINIGIENSISFMSMACRGPSSQHDIPIKDGYFVVDYIESGKIGYFDMKEDSPVIVTANHKLIYQKAKMQFEKTRNESNNQDESK